MSDELTEQLLGRARFLENRNEIKSPELMRAAAAEIFRLHDAISISVENTFKAMDIGENRLKWHETNPEPSSWIDDCRWLLGRVFYDGYYVTSKDVEGRIHEIKCRLAAYDECETAIAKAEREIQSEADRLEARYAGSPAAS